MSAGRRATIREVARECGLSPGTVSNVLNSRNDLVKPETRERVLEAVRRLNYKPTTRTRGDRPTLSKNLGLVMYAPRGRMLFSQSFTSLLMAGVTEEAINLEWSVTLFMEKMWRDPDTAIRQYCYGQCDGLIISSTSYGAALIGPLRERGIPFVILGAGNGYKNCHTIDINNTEGTRKSTEYLISIGHKRILHLTGNTTRQSAKERAQGYLEAMSEAGLEPQIVEGEFTREAGADLGDNWKSFTAGYKPTAVVCPNDASAVGLQTSLLKQGIRCPADVSIMGFDDFEEGRNAPVPLTTVRFPLEQVAAQAVKTLVQICEQEEGPPKAQKFAADLVVRDSTAPLIG